MYLKSEKNISFIKRRYICAFVELKSNIFWAVCTADVVKAVLSVYTFSMRTVFLYHNAQVQAYSLECTEGRLCNRSCWLPPIKVFGSVACSSIPHFFSPSVHLSVLPSVRLSDGCFLRVSYISKHWIHNCLIMESPCNLSIIFVNNLIQACLYAKNLLTKKN